jgi:hypothetical protein
MVCEVVKLYSVPITQTLKLAETGESVNNDAIGSYDNVVYDGAGGGNPVGISDDELHACTNAVVATWLVFVPNAAVGASSTPSTVQVLVIIIGRLKTVVIIILWEK